MHNLFSLKSGDSILVLLHGHSEYVKAIFQSFICWHEGYRANASLLTETGKPYLMVKNIPAKNIERM